MKTTHTIIIAIATIAIIIGGVAAYIFLSQPTSNSQETVKLKGAGATFPAPFINATIAYYAANVRTNVQIDYPGGGSGAG